MRGYIARPDNIDNVLTAVFLSDDESVIKDGPFYMAQIGHVMAEHHDWLFRRTHRTINTMLTHAYLRQVPAPEGEHRDGRKFVTLAARGRHRIREILAMRTVTEDTATCGTVTGRSDGTHKED